MSHRMLLGVALSFALIPLSACFARTTSLGGTDDQQSSPNDGGPALDGPVVEVDAGPAAAGPLTTGDSCKIPVPGQQNQASVCPETDYCKSDNGTCSASGGHCTTRPPPAPPFCPRLECGCDDVIRCADAARTAGHDVSPKGAGCAIKCGLQSCDGLNEYCFHGTQVPDGGGPSIYMCQPIPTACATEHSCTCVLANSGTSSGTCTDKDGKIVHDATLP